MRITRKKTVICRSVSLLLIFAMLFSFIPNVIIANVTQSVGTFNTLPMISTGHNHTVALKDEGTVWAWGANFNGQLGNGTTTNSSIPIQVQGLNSVVAIAACGNHTVALKNDGTVWAWGSNNNGQLGDGTTTNRNFPMQVQGITNVIAIAAGNSHTVALKYDGTVWAWGNKTYTFWDSRGNPVQVSLGVGDGTDAGRTIPVQVKYLSDVKAISAALSRTYAIAENGTAWAWGNNREGVLGDGTSIHRLFPVQVQNLNNVTAIAGGNAHSVALLDDGTVWSWGADIGPFGFSIMTDSYIPVKTEGFDNIVSIAVGAMHSLALRSDDTIWGWGMEEADFIYGGVWLYGGPTIDANDRKQPIQVHGTYNIAAIAAGHGFSVILTNEGYIWALGSGFSGQLGNGTSTGSAVPLQVLGLGGDGHLNLGTNVLVESTPHPSLPLVTTIYLQDFRNAIANTSFFMSGFISCGNLAANPEAIIWSVCNPSAVYLHPDELIVYHEGILDMVPHPMYLPVTANQAGLFTVTAIQPNGIVVSAQIRVRTGGVYDNVGLARYFAQDSSIYNHELARFAADLSAIAYGRTSAGGSSVSFIIEELMRLGFERSYNDIDLIVAHNYHRPIERPNHHVVAYAFAHKIIEVNGEMRPLVFVIIRGTTGDEQWHSNFSVGFRYEHYGFSRAEQELHLNLFYYLRELQANGLYCIEDGIIFVTGHSRGAAVANLLAFELNRTEMLVRTENLFAYTFATPGTTLRPNAYPNPNIFNIVNAEDFVIYIPLYVGWGFWRHGRTFAFPTRGLQLDNNGNDVFYRHRDNVARIYGELTDGNLPLFSRDRLNRVMGIVSAFHRVAPTVWDYYNTSVWTGGAGFNWYTPEEFMLLVADTAAGNTGIGRLAGIAGYLFLPTGSNYRAIAQFLANEAILNTDVGRYDNPHDENLYRAWMYAISESDLIEYHWEEYRARSRTRIIRIACPVDVRIYDSNNRLAGRVIDNIVDDTIASDLFILVEDDVTYIFASTFEYYTIRIIATDTGTMTYTIEDVDIFTLRTVERKEFVNVALYAGREFVSDVVNTSDVRLLIVDGGEIVAEVEPDGTEVLLQQTSRAIALLAIGGTVILTSAVSICYLMHLRKKRLRRKRRTNFN